MQSVGLFGWYSQGTQTCGVNLDLTASQSVLAASVELMELRGAVEIVCLNVCANENPLLSGH